MPCKELNRISKGLDTRFGSPCVTEEVNWDAFKEDDPEPKQSDKPKTKAR